MTDRTKAPEALLRRPAVRARTGLSDTRIDELEKLGRFPRRVLVSSRAVGWVQSEIDAFIRERIDARDEEHRDSQPATTA
jgi:prophage regulatory protein